MPECPKCRHKWSNRKAKKSGPVFQQLSSGRVWPHPCLKCGTITEPGTIVWAHPEHPVQVCLPCSQSAWSQARTEEDPRCFKPFCQHGHRGRCRHYCRCEQSAAVKMVVVDDTIFEGIL